MHILHALTAMYQNRLNGEMYTTQFPPPCLKTLLSSRAKRYTSLEFHEEHFKGHPRSLLRQPLENDAGTCLSLLSQHTSSFRD